jgi:hypothetical protein
MSFSIQRSIIETLFRLSALAIAHVTQKNKIDIVEVPMILARF